MRLDNPKRSRENKYQGIRNAEKDEQEKRGMGIC